MNGPGSPIVCRRHQTDEPANLLRTKKDDAFAEAFCDKVEMPRIELGSERIHRQTSTSVVNLFWFHRMRPGQLGQHPTSR